MVADLNTPSFLFKPTPMGNFFACTMGHYGWVEALGGSFYEAHLCVCQDFFFFGFVVVSTLVYPPTYASSNTPNLTGNWNALNNTAGVRVQDCVKTAPTRGSTGHTGWVHLLGPAQGFRGVCVQWSSLRVPRNAVPWE